MQAQDYPQAKWALGLRVDGCVDADVEHAVASGELLRTHVLRPTWHFVRPADIRWLLRLTGPRVIAQSASRRRELDLDDRTLGRACDAIAKALSGRRRLTRRELAPELEAAGIDTAGQRLAHMVGYAELVGLICSGPPCGKQQTYALIDEWAPGPQGPSGDDALAELATRFFTSHGPATVHDLAWSATLRVSDAKRALELTADRLDSFELGDKTYWHAGIPDDRAGHTEALLLPDFDESYVGYRSVRAEIRGRGAEATLLMGPVVIDGQVVATWRRKTERARIRVTVKPLVKLTGAEHSAIEDAAGRYERFVEPPVELEIAGV